ncbi:transporter substrate-binding domain-containing protein [Sporolactobacillus sp. STSJ-5]|uniref:transporter substrate-binding domain-containing protein n=1 Tax=Sporolactobacillus sp. STSJ-5 TaxID=2965076 RepID=UPI0021057807|nr:transporter substrate-binding domain-containing protein [Sporolactobacillus sp. STSJ-5]MCQ2009582.1 transporter substrate-binding domain-containing protein [Sporolactobacillus sp. STSJ-5]
MKKWLAGALAALLLLSVAGCGQSSGKAESQEKILRVGATGQSYPNAYKDDNGKLTGYDVEVLETIAKKLGYKVEWHLTAFDGVLGQLGSGKIDTVANAFEVTPERAKQYDFTTPYTYTTTAIAVKKDSKIQSLKDLEGKTVGGVSGSNKVDILNDYIKKNKLNIKVRIYDTREGPQTDTLKGQVAGYVQAASILQATIKKSNLSLRVIDQPLAHTHISFPFSKKSKKEQALLKKFNQQLKKLKEDGTLAKLSDKYFGIDVTKAQQ